MIDRNPYREFEIRRVSTVHIGRDLVSSRNRLDVFDAIRVGKQFDSGNKDAVHATEQWLSKTIYQHRPRSNRLPSRIET